MSGTFRSPWKRSHSAGDRSRDLSLQSESPPTPFHTSGVSLVGVGEQEPHLSLPCVPAELSAALQVPSEVGTAVWSLGRWTEISSLDCLFLGNGKIANSFCSAVSWASQQPTPCRQRLPSPAESWGGQGRWADNSHSPGPAWTRYPGPVLSLFILSGLISHCLMIHTSCLGSKSQSQRVPPERNAG